MRYNFKENKGADLKVSTLFLYYIYCYSHRNFVN